MTMPEIIAHLIKLRDYADMVRSGGAVDDIHREHLSREVEALGVAIDIFETFFLCPICVYRDVDSNKSPCNECENSNGRRFEWRGKETGK